MPARKVICHAASVAGITQPQAIGEHDPDGPHIWVEGIYRGREIYLRILARAPGDEEPGTKFDVNKRIWR